MKTTLFFRLLYFLTTMSPFYFVFFLCFIPFSQILLYILAFVIIQFGLAYFLKHRLFYNMAGRRKKFNSESIEGTYSFLHNKTTVLLLVIGISISFITESICLTESRIAGAIIGSFFFLCFQIIAYCCFKLSFTFFPNIPLWLLGCRFVRGNGELILLDQKQRNSNQILCRLDGWYHVYVLENKKS